MCTSIAKKDINMEKLFNISKIMEGRNKFILNNNMCIVETTAFLDNTMLNAIIKPTLFKENYNTIPGISDIFIDRLSFMDKYKIVCKIADFYNIERFKKIDPYLKMRNNIAHNLTTLISLNEDTGESEVMYANQKITWSEYKKMLKEWSDLSFKMAKFIMNVFAKINDERNNAVFPYCKVEGECVLVQNNLIYPEPNGEYTSFFRNGFNMDLLNYLNNEVKYNKEKTE